MCLPLSSCPLPASSSFLAKPLEARAEAEGPELMSQHPVQPGVDGGPSLGQRAKGTFRKASVPNKKRHIFSDGVAMAFCGGQNSKMVPPQSPEL